MKYTLQDLHGLIKQRHSIAKEFTKDFQNEVKENIKNYEAEDEASRQARLSHITNKKRYESIIPVIFTNHESMLASMFERPPDLVFKQRGKFDEEKKLKTMAAYDYLVDVVDVEQKMNWAAWWFILNGMCTSHQSWMTETYQAPQLDENGEQMKDSQGNPLTIDEYDYNDPILEIDDPLKIFFSPESVFSNKGEKIPYYTKEEAMDVEAVEEVFGKKVEPDTDIDTKISLDEQFQDDIKRATITFYYGTIPKKFSQLAEVEDWEYSKEYYIVQNNDKILHIGDAKSQHCTLAKWHGSPNKFFGFGIARLLAGFQDDKSIRRSQQKRYGDVASHPKILIKDSESDIDVDALTDPRAMTVLQYQDAPPEFLTPPPLSQTLVQLEEAADRDAQQASGMLSLSTGGQQQNVVKTATGQTIFAQAAEKRMQLAIKLFGRFYRVTMINLLKLARDNWDDTKIMSITDEDGEDREVEFTGEDFADIDFDRDLDIDIETITVNRDVLREQAIALYDRVKDDPTVNRKNVFKDLIRDGFNKKNPERYIKDAEVQPGTVLFDEQGNSYTVDKSGELVSKEQQEEMRDPSGGGQAVPSSQSGVIGAGNTI